MQAKGSAKDLGQGLPDPSAAADKAKGLASDAKSKVKDEANVAGDVSELPNPFDGAGGLADQVHTLPVLIYGHARKAGTTSATLHAHCKEIGL